MLSNYSTNTMALLQHIQNSAPRAITESVANVLLHSLPDFLAACCCASNKSLISTWTSYATTRHGCSWSTAHSILARFGGNARELADSELQRPLEIWLGDEWRMPWGDVENIAKALWNVWSAGDVAIWGPQPEMIIKAYHSVGEKANKHITRRLV